MLKKLLMISVVFIVSNCASTTPEPESTKLDSEKTEPSGKIDLTGNLVNTEGEELICTKRKAVGSHRVVKSCMTRSQREAFLKNSQEYMDELKNTRFPKNADPDR